MVILACLFGWSSLNNKRLAQQKFFNGDQKHFVNFLIAQIKNGVAAARISYTGYRFRISLHFNILYIAILMQQPRIGCVPGRYLFWQADVRFDRLKAFRTDDVLDPAGIFGGNTGIYAKADKPV